MNNDDFDNAVQTVLHEMFHVFAFSNDMFDYFVNPKTGQYNINDDVKIYKVDDNGIYHLKSPRVVEYARYYFDCPSLNGIEENIFLPLIVYLISKINKKKFQWKMMVRRDPKIRILNTLRWDTNV